MLLLVPPAKRLCHPMWWWCVVSSWVKSAWPVIKQDRGFSCRWPFAKAVQGHRRQHVSQRSYRPQAKLDQVDQFCKAQHSHPNAFLYEPSKYFTNQFFEFRDIAKVVTSAPTTALPNDAIPECKSSTTATRSSSEYDSHSDDNTVKVWQSLYILAKDGEMT